MKARADAKFVASTSAPLAVNGQPAAIVNLYALTARQRFPGALGAVNPERFPVASLCAAFGDQWVNPASGGLIGPSMIATAASADYPTGLPLSSSRLEHTLYGEPWVRRVGRLAATNVASRDFWMKNHEAEAKAAHLRALGVGPTNVSGGTSAR